MGLIYKYIAQQFKRPAGLGGDEKQNRMGKENSRTDDTPLLSPRRRQQGFVPFMP